MIIKHIKGDKRRKLRSRIKIVTKGRGAGKPRLSVYRSSRYLYAQLIDDVKGTTLIAVSEKELKLTGDKQPTKTERAKLLGAALAQKAKKKNIKKVVFDRGSYQFHGRVKSFADEARAGGLEF